MDADQVEIGRRYSLPYRLGSVARLYGEAELAVQDSRRRLGVGVRVDSGRDADHDFLDHTAVPGQAVQQLQLVKAVYGDAADLAVQPRHL